MTWVEKLVLVAVMALLALLLWPHSNKNPFYSQTMVCKANLKAQGSAFRVYAAENSNVLPSSNVRLSSWCEQSVAARDAVAKAREAAYAGITALQVQRTFYCPDNAAQDAAKLWGAGGVSTWGYVWLNERGAGAKLPTTFPERMVPLEYVSDTSKVRRPKDTIVALDVVVTDTDAGSLNFAPKGVAVEFGTNHVAEGRPSWVNMLFADEHLESVKFDEKTAAAVKQPGGGYFWVPRL